MNAFFTQVVILIVINIIALLLSFWVVRNDRHNPQNRFFSLMSFAIILWVDFSFAGSSVMDATYSSIFYKLNLASVVLTLLAFYYFFVVYFLGQEKHKILNTSVLVISIIMIAMSLFTNSFNNGVIASSWGMEAVQGDLINIFNIFAAIVSLLFVYFGVKNYSSLGAKERSKVVYFFVGTFLFIFANIIFNVVLPSMFKTYEYQHIGDFSAILFLGCAAYAIVRQRLFDVKLAIIRSVVYVLVLLTLTSIYLVIAFFLSTLINRAMTVSEQVVSGVAISLILVFAFQPVKQVFDKLTNKFFYKGRYHTNEFYARLNDVLTINTDLRGILQRAAKEIADTLKCEQVFFFINTTNGHYVSAGTPHHNQLPKNDAAKIGELRGTDYSAISASLLKQNDPLRRLMLDHKIEIMLPLIHVDQVVGYLCLGEQLASEGYTSRDINALNMITDELVIAVQNALAVQQIRDLNSTLKQRIYNATKELRQKNLQLRQLDKAKDEFVSVAAHELRTPMTVIRGFINLLQRKQIGDLNHEQQDILSKINLNAKNLIDLVNNMLDLSKLEANKLVINKSDNFLDDLVNGSIDKISLLYESKGVALVYNKANVRISTDAEKFERVILNLLSNAYKFTPAGGSVTISSSINIQDHIVTVCVADTGIGMPADAINKLFRKFSQVDNYLQKESGGTGLGLSICKQMVEKMGGEIWATSKPDAGSQFYFTTLISDNKIAD